MNKNDDIVASMAKRLGIVERDLKEKTALMQRVQIENDALKSKVGI